MGDAVVIATARLTYGKTGVNPITCLGGDFDGDGYFTLNDAAQVAEAQFGMAYLPWHVGRRLSAARRRGHANTSPFLPPKPQAKVGLLVRAASANQVEVHLNSSATAGETYKVLSVQFTSGTIASVAMHGDPDRLITVQYTDSFFHAAELGGRGLSWSVGHVATVTFRPGTNTSALGVSYTSVNTYVVQDVTNLACVPTSGLPCTACLHAHPARTTFDCTGANPSDAAMQFRRLCYCSLPPLPAVKGEVRNTGGAPVEDGVAFQPEVWWEGSSGDHQPGWYPICGRWFWDNDYGASLVCQALSRGRGCTSGTSLSAQNAFSTDAVAIGQCQSSDTSLYSCSGGYNHWDTWAYHGKNGCRAGQGVGVNITCNKGCTAPARIGGPPPPSPPPPASTTCVLTAEQAFSSRCT